MYLSRITLPTGALTPERIIQLIEKGEYVAHQWLWELFPGQQQRDFLYRREELPGELRFYVLSHRAPQSDHALLRAQSQTFAPLLTKGQRLRFSLRANPTVCRAGKRHDLLMNVKHPLPGGPERKAAWPQQEQAALNWLAQQGERAGFRLETAGVDGYRQQQVVQQKLRNLIQFSSVDYRGVLEVADPEAFLTRLASGFGKSRAFGCGLMLIKSADD